MVDPSFRALLHRHRNDLALVIGNGINRYRNSEAVNSWDRLLIQIARKYLRDVDAVPKGTTITEFYDVVELRACGRIGQVQSEFCELMADWRPFAHHEWIMAWALAQKAPVLTTNFDDVLSQASHSVFQFPENPRFTAYYPWGCHFAHRLLRDPCEGFGIWHINGMARYKTSVRLGLSHYMGSVQRARSWLHGHDGASLFRSKDHHRWRGRDTWMHVIFNKPLMIFGLALDESETFLRWLLIERAKYFGKFESRRKPAWYVYVDDPKDERLAGKKFFLESIGISCVGVASHDEIYAAANWRPRSSG